MNSIDESPDRVHIVRSLKPESRVRLEAQCSSLFLGCIDLDKTSNENAAAAYDLLYTLYCAKFVEPVPSPSEALDPLLEEIDSWDLRAQSAFKKRERQRTSEIWSVLRIIFAIFAVVLAALYYTGIYFTLFEEQTAYN